MWPHSPQKYISVDYLFLFMIELQKQIIYCKLTEATERLDSCMLHQQIYSSVIRSLITKSITLSRFPSILATTHFSETIDF